MKTCVGCWAGTSAVQPRRISGDQPRDTTVAKDRCGVRGRQGSSADLPPPPPPCVVPQRVGSDLQSHRGVASQSEVIIAILFEGSPCCEGLIQSGLCSVAGQGTPSCVCCVRGCGQACIVWWGQRRQAIACAGERDAGRRGPWCRQASKCAWRTSLVSARRRAQWTNAVASTAASRRRDFCHSAAPPSPCSTCFSRDGEGMSVK